MDTQTTFSGRDGFPSAVDAVVQTAIDQVERDTVTAVDAQAEVLTILACAYAQTVAAMAGPTREELDRAILIAQRQFAQTARALHGTSSLGVC